MADETDGDTGPETGAGGEGVRDGAPGGEDGGGDGKAPPQKDAGADGGAGKDGEAGAGEDKDGAGDGKGDGGEDGADYQLAPPEGAESFAEDVSAFAEQAKKLGLTREQAEGLVGWQLERIKDAGEGVETEQQRAVEQWAADAKADKEFGGDAFEENAGVARAAVEKFGGDELKRILDDSGLGNHPAMFRAFWRIGKLIADDKPADGSAPSAPPEDPKTILYG